MYDVSSENAASPQAKSGNKRHKIVSFPAQDGTEIGTGSAQRKGRRTEADRTAELIISLPAGIRLGMWKGARKRPYYVRYGKGRTLESFETELLRNDYADALAARQSEEGKSSLDVDLSDWRKWKDFRTRCDAPLHELEVLWAKHKEHRGVTCTDAVTRYLATWTGTEASFRHVRLHLRRLADAYGPLPLPDITHELLRELNGKLVDTDTGKPMAHVTKFDHRKNWNKFFEWCVVARLVPFNPCDAFVLPTPPQNERDVLTARQVFELFKSNRDYPIAGKMAFELFGFLRSSSAARLTEDHVKRDIKGLRLPGAAHKSGKTKFRQGHPGVLWEWFDHCKSTMWDVTTGIYDERKADAFIRARVENPGNVLRNSAITYMLAFTNNPPLVARLAQHTSLKMLEIYEGVATQEDARLVMAMTPKAMLLTWDQFIHEHKRKRPGNLSDPA